MQVQLFGICINNNVYMCVYQTQGKLQHCAHLAPRFTHYHMVFSQYAYTVPTVCVAEPKHRTHKAQHENLFIAAKTAKQLIWEKT